MGTYVKDGNSCIGCSLLEDFPNECTRCNNLKSKIELIKMSTEYQIDSLRYRKSLENILKAYPDRSVHETLAIIIEIAKETLEVKDA